jgi:hypothetical protein
MKEIKGNKKHQTSLKTNFRNILGLGHAWNPAPG